MLHHNTISYDRLKAKTWKQIWTFYQEQFRTKSNKEKTLWVFRGLPSTEYRLSTTLDRVHRRFGVPQSDALRVEEWMVRDFQRKVRNADLALPLPDGENILEWLSLMRHFGAPTRLMDWSYSFFVALFFAAENADSDYAVWVLDGRRINELARQALPDADKKQPQFSDDPYCQRSKTFRYLFARPDPVRLVYRLNPFHLNPRLDVQRGVFLCPGDIGFSFEENILYLQKTYRGDRALLSKIEIKHKTQSEVLEQLHQMGINSSTLFPGIDGLARSYISRYAYRDLLVPRKLTHHPSAPYSRPFYAKGTTGQP